MFYETNIKLYEFFKSVFPFLKHFQANGMQLITEAIMRGQSLKLSEISRNLTGKMPYKSKRNKVERLLHNQRIKVSVLETAYLKFLFETFFAFNPAKKIDLVIDYTDYQGVRIIFAGIPFRGRLFPCYFKAFSIKKNYSLKSIETTFLRNLKLYLPPTYKYNIVADRGFGNATFIGLCISLGFKCTLRIKGNTHVEIAGKRIKVSEATSELTKNVKFKGFKLGLVIARKNNKTWYLLTNLSDLRQAKPAYEKRFWTEEYFRDIKTYLGSNKLRYKQEILKRLLFFGMICYNFVFEIGLSHKIDTSYYSASKLSFFPQSFFTDQVSLQEIYPTSL
jgi:hypothetical protein